MIWHTIFLQPLANVYGFFLSFSAGSIVVGTLGLTIVTRLLLAPLTGKSTRFQILQKRIAPELAKIRATEKDPKLQSAAIMELYKREKSTPVAGCFVTLVQLPILIALYQVIGRSHEALQSLQYTFMPLIPELSTRFLGLPLTKASIIWGILAAGAQIAYLKLSPVQSMNVASGDTSKEAMLQKSMIYALPLSIGFISATVLPGAVSLYLIITNVLMYVNEVYIVKRMEKKELALSQGK